MLSGKHLIAGDWVGGADHFTSQPASGEGARFANAGVAEVDRAVRAAEEAFWSYSALTRAKRADFLERIADEIEARGAELTAMGHAETGLPVARLEGERGRTTGQIRLFARHIRETGFLDLRHDVALPDRQPLPRPDIRMMQRPVGPVAVFGASNFPLAFSTAGGGYGLGAGGGVSGGGEGASGPSGDGRDRGAGGGCGDCGLWRASGGVQPDSGRGQ